MNRLFCCLSVAILATVGDARSVNWDGAKGQVVLMRLKRAPNRAFSYGAFDPSNGLSAFATSADFQPYYNYVYPSPYSSYPRERILPNEKAVPEPSSYPYQDLLQKDKPAPEPSKPEGEPAADTHFPAYTGFEESRKHEPSPNLTPPAAEYGPPPSTFAGYPPAQSQKKKKKPQPSPQVTDEEEIDASDDGKSKSSSSASFNAWFPIMFGVYPPHSSSESYKETHSAPLKEAKGLGGTVISNSVSNGKNGVASSHAVLYSGDIPSQAYKQG